MLCIHNARGCCWSRRSCLISARRISASVPTTKERASAATALKVGKRAHCVLQGLARKAATSGQSCIFVHLLEREALEGHVFQSSALRSERRESGLQGRMAHVDGTQRARHESKCNAGAGPAATQSRLNAGAVKCVTAAGQAY